MFLLMFGWFSKLAPFNQIYIALLFTTVLVLLVHYKYLSYYLKPLLLLAAFHLTIELLTGFVSLILLMDNYFVYHFVAPLEYVIFCIFFYRALPSTDARKSILASVPIFIVLLLIFELFWESSDVFNSLAFMTEAFFAIYLFYLFYRNLLLKEEVYYPERNPVFWAATGILFYFIGNFFILGTLSYFLEHDLDTAKKLYFAGYSFNFILYFTIMLISFLEFPMDPHE